MGFANRLDQQDQVSWDCRSREWPARLDVKIECHIGTDNYGGGTAGQI
jgi:hypothetical protein